jgi:hypothetical protein
MRNGPPPAFAKTAAAGKRKAGPAGAEGLVENWVKGGNGGVSEASES